MANPRWLGVFGVVGSILAASGGLGAPAHAAEAPAAPAPAAPAPKPTPSPTADWDRRPVGDFLRSPATVLLSPEEVLKYQTLVDSKERRGFIEAFWASMAENCLPGANPAHDLFLQRVDEADTKFGDEGVPGWITDRGQVYLTLGAPEKSETKDSASGRVLLWSYPEQPGRPKVVAFLQRGLDWEFAGADTVDPAATTISVKPMPVLSATQNWAALFRKQGCVLTPEQRAAAAAVAWRTTLFDLAGKVLAGEKPEVQNPIDTNWFFFPAEGDATFVALTVPLEQSPEAGGRPVAMLRPEGAEDEAKTMGTTDVPFEVRQVGSGYVAQAVRALAPGRYAYAVGLVAPTGEVTTRAVGEQLIVRMPKDNLRLTSVVLADKLQPLGSDLKTAPFKMFGFDVTPNPARLFHPGSAVTLFYAVLGAGTDAGGKVDLKISYQIFFNRAGTWIKAMQQPVVSPHQLEPVQAREFQIPARWPAGDYKVVVEVADNRSNSQVTQEVQFKIKP